MSQRSPVPMRRFQTARCASTGQQKDPTWATRALGAAKQAESLDDQLLEVRLALGSIYQATGRTAEALIEFTKASEVAPTSADVASRLARAYLAIGRAEEAIQAYERAITLDPYHWVGYGALGTALMGLGQYRTSGVPTAESDRAGTGKCRRTQRPRCGGTCKWAVMRRRRTPFARR